jgi:hypothetical protein
MDRRVRGGYGVIALGIVLVLVGGAFLLDNAGVVDLHWSSLWPAVLIVVGAVVIVGALRERDQAGSGERSVTIDAQGSSRLELALRLGAGHYVVAGDPAAALVVASANEPAIVQQVVRAGEVARVRLATAVDGWSWPRATGHHWRIGVAPGIPTVVDVQAGAGEFDVDMSSIEVVSAFFGIGAASLDVVLPHPSGDVPVRVEGGAASFTFRIPPGVDARVTSSGFLTSSGPTETPGYAAARDRVTVTVTGGAASVRVVPAA